MLRTRWLSMTGRATAFLGLAALCSLGCVTSPSLPDHSKKPPPGADPDTTSNPDSTDVPQDSIDVPQAFFTLDGADLRESSWPTGFAQYSLFVCNPSMSVDEVAKIHRDVPGALALTYTSAQDVPIGVYAGNPYFDALAAAFDSTLCLRDLHTGNVIREGGSSGPQQPAFILSQASADILVAFIRDHGWPAGWDGLYIDQCTSQYPPWREAFLDSVTTSFDCDGDGVADSMGKLESQYATWRPYFTRRLREELGTGSVLVANAGGPLVDSYLNGITLEGVGTRFAIADARSYLQAQLAVSRAPFTAVLWITASGSQEPSLLLAREVSGVYYGTVAYFR